jgi:hypothetical protein
VAIGGVVLGEFLRYKMADEKRRVGRPPKEKKVEDYPVATYMPDKEAHEMVKRAAELNGMSVSAWARSVLVREARRVVRGED